MYDGSGDDAEVKFVRERGFFDRSSAIRFLIGAVFAICLFAFIHFREVRVEMLELGSIAPRYVVAQVDFEFLDEEATIILKQEAVRDIGKIFQLAEKDVQQARTEFENYLIYNQDWRQRVEQTTFEEMYQGIDLFGNTLRQMRFTDPRTRRKMEELGLDYSNYLIYTPVETGQPAAVPEELWQQVVKIAFAHSKLQAGTADFMVQYFKERNWVFVEDLPAQRALRKQVQSRIADRFTKVSAGSRIIDQGDKVTMRHLAMLQAMKKALSDGRNLWHPLTLIGSALLTLLLVALIAIYFKANCKEVLASNRQLFLIATIILLTFAFAKIFEFFVVTSSSNFADKVKYPLFAPFVAMLLCNLMNQGIATFLTGIVTVILTMTLAVDRQEFLVTNVVAALTAILCTRTMRRRKEIFIVSGLSWLSCAVVILAFHLYDDKAFTVLLLADLVSSCLFMLLTAVLVVGLLPLLESTFDMMTDVTLMEYMDPNHELLRRLTMEAPGTYQHSVVVGNLAESAALSIGANGLFCRVACLYHDIGKLATPQYFTENQQGGMNIHQLLTPLESTQVIINHVSEGVAMGRKAGLPEQFIDIIKEHHGTTLVYYFYRKQLEQVEGDESLIDERDFRYAGPKPRSKESAIIMIADSMEAASRSLEEVNEEALSSLVTSLVRQKSEDGQLDECQLTFEELGVVKRAMVKTLVAAGHARIKYPTRERKGN